MKSLNVGRKAGAQLYLRLCELIGLEIISF